MPDDPEPPIADAASLYDTDEIRLIRPKAAEPAPVADPGGYELEVDPHVGPEPSSPVDPDPLSMTGRRSKARRPTVEATPDPDAAPPPIPVAAPSPRPKPKLTPNPVETRAPSGDTSEFDTELAVVDPIWTRGAEWGPDLARLGMVGAGTLVMAWLLSGSVSLVLLVLAVGGAAMVLLSYPILVTLERPVRITPEQAVTDFFAAASHHFPSYRRMWLLLSTLGREPGRFATFEEFRDHWRSRVEGWKGSGGAGKWTPLKFAVVDFQADKSTGKSTSKAEYTVHVLVRGRVQDGPVASFRMAHGLVKGPDRMWYLNRGTLDSTKP